MRANRTWVMRVYHTLIYHDWHLGGINCLLRRPKPDARHQPLPPNWPNWQAEGQDLTLGIRQHLRPPWVVCKNHGPSGRLRSLWRLIE